MIHSECPNPDCIVDTFEGDGPCPECFAAPAVEHEPVKVGDGYEYRGYMITYDPPPIPTRMYDWAWSSKHDFENGEKLDGHNNGFAKDLKTCIDQIDEHLNQYP